jgi:hypothetical protein
LTLEEFVVLSFWLLMESEHMAAWRNVFTDEHLFPAEDVQIPYLSAVEISSFTSGTSRAKGCNTVPLAVLFAMF